MPDPSSPTLASPDRISAQPIAWGLVGIPALALFILHLATQGRFGIFRDEYYYLACAERPAWGFVDQPPFSIWVLAAWKSVFGDSVLSIRILPALCGSAMVLLAAATAARLGGARWAQALGALGVAINPSLMVISGFYSMNAFDFLFWLGAYYFLIRIAGTDDGRGWIPFGLVVGLGLFNKIGLLVLGVALVVGLVATRHRRHFADRRLYLGGAIALAFLVPYAAWNALNDWAALEFIENAKSGKITAFTPWEFLRENILGSNPVTLPIWLGGLAWLAFARSARRFQLVAWMFVATFAILSLQRSKPYYFATSFPVLVVAGGVAWERWTSGRRVTWTRWFVATGLVAGGALVMPMAVPLLTPEKTLAYGQRTGLVPAPQELGHTSALPQYFSDRFGWENLARVVSEVYLALPEEERERCVVLGQNYGHAGAIEYWARKYPLPPAYSTHNNYWLWGPPPDDADTVIVIRGDPELLGQLFDEVVEVAVASTPGAIESRMTLRVCRGLRRPIADIWREFKSFG